MALINVLAKVATVATSGVASVGSLVIHHDAETGKDSLNLVPAVMWFYGLSVVGCSLSRDEVFSQCVKGVLSVIGG